MGNIKRNFYRRLFSYHSGACDLSQDGMLLVRLDAAGGASIRAMAAAIDQLRSRAGPGRKSVYRHSASKLSAMEIRHLSRKKPLTRCLDEMKR